MFCFTMRVHNNLVGSVSGKSQTNNSGSDKRELYTIAQALQKPYHDLLFTVHRIIIRFNGWKGVVPDCPFIQLTTLDEHADAKQVTTMAKLITNDDTLRQYLPNVFATVKGEVSLFDKVKVDINLAENWVIETFVSTNTFNTICGYAEDNPIKIITAKLIATEALSWAIPSLDLVLTPNGFGVVSTQTSLRHRKNVLTV